MKATCGLISLGCAKNLVDAEVMLGSLKHAGYGITSNEDEADVLIVNTCGFIGPAAIESSEALRTAVERKRRGSCRTVVATGCLVQRDVELLRRRVPGIDAFVGLNEFPHLAELLDRLLESETSSPENSDHNDWRFVTPDVQYLYDESTPRVRATPPWYSYLKISEGCDHRCTFCIIPRMRGNMRCRPLESIAAEAAHLVSEGVREIILIAQDTTRYGLDLYGRPMLAELLRRVAATPGLNWLRVLYAYPLFINDELIEVMAEHSNICRYLDVPLQHAHPEMLKAMRRAGSPDGYRRMIDRLRDRLSGVAVRTTFIVGFPGETEAHFAALRRFVEATEFDRFGVFTFSPEREAPASHYEAQIPDPIKQERARELMELQREISRKLNRGWKGREVEVLLEERAEKDSTAGRGRTERDAPEIDAHVRVRGLRGSVRPGTFVRARITKTFDYDMEGWALN